jgi:hypothetical protein
MREILNEEEQAADGDDDGDSEASIDIPCDDIDKVLNCLKPLAKIQAVILQHQFQESFDQISFSNDERKNSGISISSASRPDDCDRVSSGQAAETVSFLASRLPDLEKLDSILEQQVRNKIEFFNTLI